MDIDDLTRIIIRQIIYYSNHHELKGYRRHPAMAADGVPSVPRELWRWGIAKEGGLARIPKEELFLFALLPTATASVTANGIKFHGNHYTCPHAVRKKWFEKARTKRFPCTISYAKRDSDRVFVHIDDAPNGYEVAELTPSSRRRLGWSGWEIEEELRAIEHVSADRRDEQTMARAGMEAANEAEVAAAKAEYEALPDKDRASEQTKDLRAKTAEERDRDRAEDVADYQARMGVRKRKEATEPVQPPVDIPEVPATEVASDPTSLPAGAARKPHAKPSMRDMLKAAAGSNVA